MKKPGTVTLCPLTGKDRILYGNCESCQHFSHYSFPGRLPACFISGNACPIKGRGSYSAIAKSTIDAGILQLAREDNPYDTLYYKDMSDTVRSVLYTLTVRERQVLWLRFGFYHAPMTRDRIGNLFHVTSERIRMIDDKALRKLRHKNRMKRLREAVEWEY